MRGGRPSTPVSARAPRWPVNMWRFDHDLAPGERAPMTQVEAGARRSVRSGCCSSASDRWRAATMSGRRRSAWMPARRISSPAGPSAMTNSTACSRSAPIVISMSQRCREMSSNPARTRMSVVVSALAIENGPGPQVGSSVASGGSRTARRPARRGAARRCRACVATPPCRGGRRGRAPAARFVGRPLDWRRTSSRSARRRSRNHRRARMPGCRRRGSARSRPRPASPPDERCR